MIFLRQPTLQDMEEVQTLYKRSASLHQPWTYPPENYASYLQQEGRYFVCLEDSQAIIGTFIISGIVRGHFQSAYLGYEAFSPYQGKGFMREGLVLVLKEAFETLNLHRLEANIQPENEASIRLVSSAGFVKEGFSKNYLNIGGFGWKDHERWAFINENHFSTK